MDGWPMLGPRDPGDVPRSRPPRLHHGPDHGLSPRAKEGRPAGEANQQCAHFRGRRFTGRGTRAQGRFVDELLRIFGFRMQPLMAHLIESGKLKMKDVKEAEETLRKLAKKGKSDD
jgi:hypothetical protein